MQAKYSAEEKVPIVLEGLREEKRFQEYAVAKASTRTCVTNGAEFLEAGKQRLVGDTKREADSTKANDLRSENKQFKAVVAELTLNNRRLKKSLLGRGITTWDD